MDNENFEYVAASTAAYAQEAAKNGDHAGALAAVAKAAYQAGYADSVAHPQASAVPDGWKDPTGFSAEMVKDEAEQWTHRETGKKMLLNYAKFLSPHPPEAVTEKMSRPLSALWTPQWENVMSEFTSEQVCDMATNVRDCAWPADVKPYMELIEPVLRDYAALLKQQEI